MSDRRRNLFVLLTVRGPAHRVARWSIFTKPTKLGLDLQGGVQLVYEARPTKQQPTVTQEALDRALDIMRDRVDSLGVAEPELQRSGENQIDVEPPGRRERRARRRPGRHHGPDVLLRLGTEHPRRGLQDQPGAGQRRPAADQRALQRGQAGVEVPPEVDDNNTTTGLFYAFDKKSNEPINDGVPEETRADLEEDLEAQGLTDSAEILEVPEGIIVVRAVDERDPDQQQGEVDSGGSSRTTRSSAAPTSRTRSRTSRTAPAARRSSRWSSATGAARRSPRRRARSPSAAPTTRRSTAASRTRSPPRTTSRSGSTTS